jgi:hypothetical protein
MMMTVITIRLLGTKMKYKSLIVYSLILGSSSLFADPITDYMFGHSWNSPSILKYMEKKYIVEKGSLPTVSSRFKNSFGRIQGSSYTVEVIDNGIKKEILLTNAHLLQGDNKKIVFDTISEYETIGGDVESKEFLINDSEVDICADQDIAIVDLTRIKSQITVPNFGTYNIQKNKITTHGMNNSPRGYYLMDSYGDSWPESNRNKKPLFKNTQTGEMLNFIQMGNMFDFSCNYFPSSPEHYDGNAIFIPINSRVKSFTVEPSPFVQKIFNNVNSLYVHQQRVKYNTCHVEMSSKLKDDLRVKTSHFSSNLVVPSGIVPGMSGAPLVSNNDLRQSEYEIIGMVSSYNRRMQQSHFISTKNIKKCIHKALSENRDESNDKVEFAYSAELNTLYRKSNNYVEVPLSTGSAGHYFGGDGAAGNGGDGAAGNGGDGAAGNGGNCDTGVAGDGAAGNGGDGAAGNGGNCDTGSAGDGAAGNGGETESDNTQEIKPVSGMLFKGEHVLGFNCPVANTSVNLFANWEYKSFVEATNRNCHPIALDSTETLSTLLRKKLNLSKVKKVRAVNNNLHSLKLSAKLTILKTQQIKLNISGSYYLKESDSEIDFRDEIIIDSDLKRFNPYYEIKIKEDNITNFFNSYEGGESLVLDLKELFFINLEQIKKSDSSIDEILLENNKAKLYGSLKYKEASKGSIPVELVWK